MKIFETGLYKWYKTGCYLAALAVLSEYDGSQLVTIIGTAVIAYMLTSGLRTYSATDNKPVYGG